MGPPDLLVLLQTDTTVLDQLLDSRFQQVEQRCPIKARLCLEATVELTTGYLDLPPTFRGPKHLDSAPVGESKVCNTDEKYDAVSWREIRSRVFELCQQPLRVLDQLARWTNHLGGVELFRVDIIF